MLLEKAKIDYVAIDAEEEKELTNKLNVKKAPTLFVPAEEATYIFDNASDIKRYIEGLKK